MEISSKTVQLSGNFDSITPDKLQSYVSDQTKPGEIVNFIFQNSGPLVTFNETAVARSFASQSHHEFLGIRFGALLVEEWPKADACKALEIKMPKGTSQTQSTLIEQFRRFCEDHAGIDCVEEIFYDSENRRAVITFKCHDTLQMIMRSTAGKQIIEDQILIMEPLTPANPPIFVENPEKKTLLFYGLNEDCLENVEKLRMFIEKCSLCSIKQLFFSPKYDRILVHYNDEPNYENVLSVLCSKPFQGTMMSVQKLPKTTQFQVMNGNTPIQYFEMFGKVNLRIHDGIAIITLEDEIAADKFQLKAASEQFVFVPFYEEFGDIPKGFDWLKPPSFVPNDVTIPIDKKVYEFLLINKIYKDNIESALEKLQCSVTWQSSLRAILTWTANHDKDRASKSWPSNVIECFKQNIGLIDHCNIQVSPSEYTFVLFHVKGFESNNNNITIEYDGESNRFFAIGPWERISEFRKLVENNCVLAANIPFELLELKSHEMQLIKKLPAYEDIKKQCEVQVLEEKTECLMLLSGNGECIKQVKLKVIRLKNTIKENDMDLFPKFSNDFTRIMLRFIENSSVVERIESSFEQHKVIAVVNHDSKMIKVHSFHDLEEAQKLLKAMFQVTQISSGNCTTFIDGMKMYGASKKPFGLCKHGANSFLVLTFADDSTALMQRFMKLVINTKSDENLEKQKKESGSAFKAHTNLENLKLPNPEKENKTEGKSDDISNEESEETFQSASDVITRQSDCETAQSSLGTDDFQSTKISLHSDEGEQSIKNDDFKIRLPPNWESNMERQPGVAQTPGMKLMVLNRNSPEFGKVEELFHSLLSITKIQRIENPRLYKMFKSQNEFIQHEKQLWYGTTSDMAPEINTFGFTRTFTHTDGCYGKGIYLHIDPGQCMKLCYERENRKMCFYLVRVLLGNVVQGSQKPIESLLMNQGSMQYYDSVVDSIDSPKTYVIFDGNHIYPEYLVTV